MSSTRKQGALDVPFVRGLRQDVESTQMVPSGLVRADNVEFVRRGALKRREAFMPISTTKTAKLLDYSGPARRVVNGTNNQRLIFTDDSVFAASSAPSGVCEATVLDQQTHAIRASLTNRFAVGSDQSGTILFCDCALVNQWLVTVYTQYINGRGYCVVLDALNIAAGGSRSFTGIVIEQAVSDKVQPRVCAVGGNAVVVWALAAGTNLRWAAVDFTATPIAAGIAPATLITNGNGTSDYFDISTTNIGGFFSGFLVAWSALIAGNHSIQVQIFNVAGGTAAGPFTMNTKLGAPWAPSAVGCIGADSTTDKLYVAGWDSATANLEVMSSTYDLVTRIQDSVHEGAVSGAVVQIAVGKATVTPASSACIAFSTYFSTAMASDPRGHLWLSVIDSADILSSATPFGNYAVGSKFYRDSDGNLYIMGRFNDPSGGQSHYMLFDYGPDPQSGTSTRRPQSTLLVANGLVPLVPVGIPDVGVGGMCGSGDDFIFAGPENLGATAFSGQQVGIWAFEALNKKRYLPIYAQSTPIVGGASPLAYDGQRLYELSFFSYPCVSDLGAPFQYTTNTLGGFIEKGAYGYRFVYEWTDAAGNRHQSAASPIVIVDMSASATDTNTVTWTIPCLNATRKQSAVDDASPVRIIAYRTKKNETAATSPLYRLAHGASTGYPTVNDPVIGVNNAGGITPVTIVDDISNADVGTLEPLYAQTQLSDSAPPASTLMCVHGDRIWGLDDEHPERIWYTKVFQEGESPSWNPGLFVNVTGAGKIHGIASQDGKLYALTLNGLFLASYGDGPDNTGVGSFPAPILLTADCACDEPRSVVQASTGIFFSGPDQDGTGIYFLPRGAGTPVSIGRRIRDELNAYPEIRGAIDRKDKSRVEFLLSATNSSANKIAYYYYAEPDENGLGEWTMAVYGNGVHPLESLGAWDGISVLTVGTGSPDALDVLVQSGSSDEQDNTTLGSPVVIETGDMRPFGLLGYGEQISLTVYGKVVAAGAYTFEVSFDSGYSYSEMATWPLSTEASGQPILRHWESRTKKLDSAAMRFRFADYAPAESTLSKGMIWNGFSIETVPLGGNVPLPTESSM